MRHGGPRIRQLVCTLATAGVALACAPAAEADHLSPDHDFSFSAKSARVTGGSLVLTGVDGNGLLRNPGRREHAKISVRQFVREWKRLGSRPFAAGSHARDGRRELVTLRPYGTPKYDARKHRLTLKVRDRRSRKLADTRWVFGHRKAAAAGYSSQSKRVGPYQLVVTAPALANTADVAVIAGGAVITEKSLSVTNPISEIQFGILGQGTLSATVRYAPPVPGYGGTVFLTAAWTDPVGGSGQFSGLLAQFQSN
jgi:hypothetical protein